MDLYNLRSRQNRSNLDKFMTVTEHPKDPKKSICIFLDGDRIRGEEIDFVPLTEPQCCTDNGLPESTVRVAMNEGEDEHIGDHGAIYHSVDLNKEAISRGAPTKTNEFFEIRNENADSGLSTSVNLPTKPDFKLPAITEYASIEDYCDRKKDKDFHCPLKLGKSVPPLKTSLTKNRPYVPWPLEELASASSIVRWTNHKVRVNGKVSCSDGTEESFCVVSEAEPEGPFRVGLDLSCIGSSLPTNVLVEIFGEFNIVNAIPEIKVQFFRRLESTDLYYHNKSLEILKSFVPLFISKDNRDKSSRTTDTAME